MINHLQDTRHVRHYGIIILALAGLTINTAFASDKDLKSNSQLPASSLQTAVGDLQTNSDQVLQLELENLSLKLDKRFSTVRQIAKTIANDTHIHAWVDKGMQQESESLLIDKLGFLLKKYGLTSASFADKTSHRYYNHEGFLAVLSPESAPWYFAYLESGAQDLVSVYHDKNKNRVDIYVNYQQVNGNGLSGIASSYNSYVDLLAGSPLHDKAELFIIDGSGKVQVRAEKDLFVDENIFDSFDKKALESIMAENSTQWIELPKIKRYDDQRRETITEPASVGISYLPSVGWYVLAHIGDSALSD